VGPHFIWQEKEAISKQVGEPSIGIQFMLYTYFICEAWWYWLLSYLVDRYTFGLSSNNVGLLLLLDKCPRIQKTLTRTK